jgi:hypothetical protein
MPSILIRMVYPLRGAYCLCHGTPIVPPLPWRYRSTRPHDITAQLRPWEPAPNSNWTSQNPQQFYMPTLVYQATINHDRQKRKNTIILWSLLGTLPKNSWYVFDFLYLCVSYKQQHRDVSVDIRTTAVWFTHTHTHTPELCKNHVKALHVQIPRRHVRTCQLLRTTKCAAPAAWPNLYTYTHIYFEIEQTDLMSNMNFTQGHDDPYHTFIAY